MYNIIDSMTSLYHGITVVEWAAILALFVFCAVLGRMRYFSAISLLVVLAWLMRDLSGKAQFDINSQWAFTLVVLASMVFAICMIFTSLKRSGW